MTKANSLPAVETIPALEVLDLGKAFGPKTVLSDIRMRLGPGDRMGLSGPNGSGKTTLLRCIAGTVTPTTGAVTVDGHPGGSLAARARTGVATAHETAFYQRLTGLRNLLFYASLRASSASEARREVDALVEELEIGSFVRERVDRYSSGMSQQLAVARALLGEPALLILDEPTRSLDADAEERFWRTIDARPEVTLVIATHQKSDLARCSHRIDLS